MIFTPQEWYDMAAASERLSALVFTTGSLTNTLVKVSSLDDPYYMSELSSETYQALLRRGF